MARPRKSDRQEMATVRIENAFWELLETVPFADITVMRIAQESGVNRNSFYYHYKDINDLAYQAFAHNANNEVTSTLIDALLSSFSGEGDRPLVFDPSILTHTRRIMLYAASDAPYLTRLAHDLLKEAWLSSLKLREDLLSPEERVEVDFIFAGLVSTLGSREIREYPRLLSALASSEIGRAMVSTMAGIASRVTQDQAQGKQP